MQDPVSRIRALKRPTLLARAARLGADHYRRSAYIRRIMEWDRDPGQMQALVALLDRENELNLHRLSRQADYSVVLHLDVLIALLGELRQFTALNASNPI